MYLTPKPLRQIVGMMTGRKAHDFMVRTWTGVLFYGIIGIVIGFALAVIFPESING